MQLKLLRVKLSREEFMRKQVELFYLAPHDEFRYLFSFSFAFKNIFFGDFKFTCVIWRLASTTIDPGCVRVWRCNFIASCQTIHEIKSIHMVTEMEEASKVRRIHKIQDDSDFCEKTIMSCLRVRRISRRLERLWTLLVD